MLAFLTAHSPLANMKQAMNNSCREWLQKSHMQKVVIFLADSDDYSGFVKEVEACVGEGCQIETVVLKPLTTDFESPKDIQQLAWLNLNTITSQMDDTSPKTVFLGRGSALHDHLMWLASRCRDGVNVLHFDNANAKLEAQTHSSIEDNQKGFITLAAVLENHVEDILNMRAGHVGWSHAHRLGGRPGGAIESGVRKALGPAINAALVDIEGVEKSVTYRLNPSGIEKAMLAYFGQSEMSEKPLREVLISFARLPTIQGGDDGQTIRPFSFFNLIAPLQPVDGLICVLQRIDDSVEGTHIMTLETACEVFETSSFIGDLRHARHALEQRSSEDSIRVSSHLVVINPTSDNDCGFELILQLLAVLKRFENDHGHHHLRIDTTSPLAQIRAAVSKFGLLSNSKMTYTLKARRDERTKESKQDSMHAKRDHCINLPGMVAYEAFQKASNSNKNNQYDVKMLRIFLAYESQQSESDIDDFDPFSETPKHQEPPTIKELLEFAKTNSISADIEIPKPQANRVIKRLRSRGLIAVCHLQEKAITRYELTDIGNFVANQMMLIQSKEASI